MKKNATGCPSIDKPWLEYYKEGVYEKSLNTPRDKSFYRYYRENIFTDPDFPIIKYFNATLSTKQFLELIELWAKAFRAAGVEADEMVPVYGTWSPEIAAIFFALNAIGAHPYYEKLDITESALREETTGAKVAVVFEPLWNDIAKAVFSDDQFTKVFMVGLADSMKFPLKQIISLRNKNFRRSATNKKYVFRKQVKELASQFNGEFEEPFKKDRIAVITTSSGTTSSLVKGIMDTNEGALANVIATAYSEPGFIAGKECLITLPPTASTAVNCFFLLPLLMGMTVRIDPRADEENYVRLLLKYKPSLAASTGSLWHSFYRKIDNECRKGHNVDLSFLDTFILGGSGVTPEQLSFINEIAKKCRVQNPMDCGYGCSEFFGVITVDKHEINYDPVIKDVIDVGIPIPGATVGIFDENGKELGYGERGEIWAKGPSTMHGYFGKQTQTDEMFEEGWLKTGDIGAIDENGYVYCYGRKKSSIEVGGKPVYLFDISNTLRRELNLEDCMVEIKQLEDGEYSIVIYYVQKQDIKEDNKSIINKMHEIIREFGVDAEGFIEFENAFPISPTTLKPKTRYTDGFIDYLLTGEKLHISYSPTNTEGVWRKNTTMQ